MKALLLSLSMLMAIPGFGAPADPWDEAFFAKLYDLTSVNGQRVCGPTDWPLLNKVMFKDGDEGIFTDPNGNPIPSRVTTVIWAIPKTLKNGGECDLEMYDLGLPKSGTATSAADSWNYSFEGAAQFKKDDQNYDGVLKVVVKISLTGKDKFKFKFLRTFDVQPELNVDLEMDIVPSKTMGGALNP